VTDLLSPAVGTIDASYIDPDGVEWPLSTTTADIGWFTTNAIGGWGAAPITIVPDPVARGGETVRHVRANPRRLTWPLHIHGEDVDGYVTHMLFVQRYRALLRAITMTTHRRRPGIMRVARPDGSAREIDVWYEDGLGGEPGENWVFANPVITLYCPDGYWRDTQPQTVTRRNSGTAVPYLTNYPTVSSSQVLGATTVNNSGEVEAWPVWTLTGPAAGLTATNHTTDQMFALTAPLAAGQTLTITTNRPTVRGPAGENLVGALDWPASELWPLAPGDNAVDFQVAGASTGTEITLTYYPRYEAA
jgi:hypothetical protein